MRRRLLTTVCAGALLAFAPAARADAGQPFTASGQTPTDTRFAQLVPDPVLNPTTPVLPPTVPFSLPAPSSPGTPTPPVPGRRVCFAAVPLPGLDASTPLPSADTTLATAAENKNLTSDTLLANWVDDSDVWRSIVGNQASRRVEGKQPLLLTLSTKDAVRAKPNPTGPGMRQTKVTFRTDFTAQQVDQDNCVTGEVPVDSLAIHSKVSFGGHVDKVGQANGEDYSELHCQDH